LAIGTQENILVKFTNTQMAFKLVKFIYHIEAYMVYLFLA